MKTQSFLGRLTVLLAALSLIIFSSTASARKHELEPRSVGCVEITHTQRSWCKTVKVKFQKGEILKFNASVHRLDKKSGDFVRAHGVIKLFRNGKQVKKWRIIPRNGWLKENYKVNRTGKYHFLIVGDKHRTSVSVKAYITGFDTGYEHKHILQ